MKKEMTYSHTLKREVSKKINCPICKGDGYTAEHDLPSRHGEYGECINCPIQVQCENCLGTGKIEKGGNSSQR